MKFTMYTRLIQLIAEKGPERAADDLLAGGFSSAEILESTAGDHPAVIRNCGEAEHVRRVFASRGLSFACYSVGTTIWKDPSAVESLCRQTEIAAALGCPYFHHTSLLWLAWDASMPPLAEGIEAAVEAAAKVARHAESLGVTCIYEDQGMYLNGVENFGLFYREMKNRCSNVGVCGDMGNSLFVDTAPEDFFHAFAKEIRHVHVKDYLRKQGPDSPGMFWYPTQGGNFLRETMVGSGAVDIGACIRILKDAGYDGNLALELCHPEPFEAGVRQAMAYISRFL